MPGSTQCWHITGSLPAHYRPNIAHYFLSCHHGGKRGRIQASVQYRRTLSRRWCSAGIPGGQGPPAPGGIHRPAWSHFVVPSLFNASGCVLFTPACEKDMARNPRISESCYSRLRENDVLLTKHSAYDRLPTSRPLFLKPHRNRGIAGHSLDGSWPLSTSTLNIA